MRAGDGQYQHTPETNCTWHYQPCLCPQQLQSLPGTNIEGAGEERARLGQITDGLPASDQDRMADEGPAWSQGMVTGTVQGGRGWGQGGTCLCSSVRGQEWLGTERAGTKPLKRGSGSGH